MSEETKVVVESQQEKVKRLVVKAAIRMVPLEKLQVDTCYQREVKGKHKKIVADFNPEAFGVPLVGEREDGSLWIVDGLQRITAVRKLGWREAKCEVFRSTGPEHEAEVFKLVNMNRTRLTPAEEFRALLTSHDPAAWAIKETVTECGYSICMGKSGKSNETASKELTCITTLRSIYKEGGTDPIKFALNMVKEAWPGDRLGVHNTLIHGLAGFYTAKECLVDTERLLPRLRTVTPHKIIYAAGQATLSGDRRGAVVQIIEKLYTKRLSPRKGS